jgi:L-alanine-DL-glutamate epimerase-like enolase superfamily enzyme
MRRNRNLYGKVRGLPLSVEGFRISRNVLDTRQERTTTEFRLEGQGHVGYGEDVTTSVNEALFDRVEAHRNARAANRSWFDKERYEAKKVDVKIPKGEYTLNSFYEEVDSRSLWNETPKNENLIRYRRWAVESAALDLALKQADETLASILGRKYEPVEFVKSLRLSNDSLKAVKDWLRLNPNLEFKIDVTPNLSRETLAELSDTATVRVLDMKGQYGHRGVGAPVDAELYRDLFETFPDALVEDPVITDETEDVLRRFSHSVSWDAPITGVEAVESLSWEPSALNVKPCRFGSVESLFKFLEYAEENDIKLYGGGMIELGAGRAHLQAIASLFYPDAPNDIAPTEYHVYEPGKSVPTSPIHPPDVPSGLGW